jgi:hypothetical protein
MYLDEIAEQIKAALDPADLPDVDQGEFYELLRLYAVLVRAKGRTTTAEDVHDAWVAWMAKIDPGHEALQPFEKLDPSTQREDAPFLRAILIVASAR